MRCIPGFIELHLLETGKEPVWIAVSSILRFQGDRSLNTIRLEVTNKGDSVWLWAEGYPSQSAPPSKDFQWGSIFTMKIQLTVTK